MFEFTVIHHEDRDHYLRISKDTKIMFSCAYMHEDTAQTVASLSCILDTSLFAKSRSLVHFPNDDEYKGFLWIINAFLDIGYPPILSPSEIISSTVSGSLDNLKNWITKQEPQLNDQKLIIIRNIEKFRTLSPDLKPESNDRIWKVIWSFLHRLMNLYASKRIYHVGALRLSVPH